MTADTGTLTFALVRTAFDHVAQHVTYSWSEWREILTAHDVVTDDKHFRPGFVPGVAPCVDGCKLKHNDNAAWFEAADGYTTDAHMRALHALVFDVDGPQSTDDAVRGATRAQITDVVRRLGELSLVVYTSATQPASAAEHRVRIVVPFAQPVPRAEWREVWLAAVWRYGGSHIDRVCKNASRYYVLPSMRADERHHWAVSKGGSALDWGALVADYRAAVPKVVRAAAATMAAVETGTSKQHYFEAIKALAQLQDGRWHAVRTLAFTHGKATAYGGGSLNAALQTGMPLFEAALSQCELSEANGYDKLTATADACIRNGWHVRRTEIEELRASIERARKAGNK